MSEINANVDATETEKFDRMAAQWWDPEGECRALHDINAPRLNYIAEKVDLAGMKCLDIGCGGGLLSEALARAGSDVVGIDLAKRALAVARMHGESEGLSIDYRLVSAEALAASEPAKYGVICCMELLEHVPKPQSIIDAAAELLTADGHLFLSTINRHPLAWAGAIVGAEHILGLLPKGTHRYERFIKPSELAEGVRQAGLQVQSIVGLHYNPFSRTARVGGRPMVNYFLHATKPGG